MGETCRRIHLDARSEVRIICADGLVRPALLNCYGMYSNKHSTDEEVNWHDFVLLLLQIRTWRRLIWLVLEGASLIFPTLQ
jgi:hypothetical protein